jgi:hypothetical protein
MRAKPRTLALFAALAASACTLHASDARADTSSFLSVGGGYGLQHSDSRDYYDRATAMSFGLGVGSSPLAPVVVGGMLRSTTYFTLGTDLGVAARIATGGFARGQWGLALDIGPNWRVWKGAGDYGRFPLSGLVLVGAPWGVQLGIGADVYNLEGTPAARGAVALLEIDLLRLTVLRQGATDRWWENPSPAGGRLPRE